MQVSSSETCVHASVKAADEELADLTELLMVQLLKSDSVEAEGEARARRRFEVLLNYETSLSSFSSN